MSYQQGGPRRPRPDYGREMQPEPPLLSGRDAYRPPPPRNRPAYHQTRMMPLPTEEPQQPAYGDPREGQQPPPRREGPPQGYPPPPGRRPPRKRRWGRRIGIVLLVILLLLGGVWLWLDLSINRVAALADYPGRPAAASGTNWLIVGSDSREGMTPEEQAELSTGGNVGPKRTDTILIAHLPDNDTPATLISLPRDTQVDIPGHGEGKINAAFNYGPATLVQTVELKTKLRMDHYAEISFAGFAKIVDAIGGVEMNIEQQMHDNETGVTIEPGLQELNGAQALAFVRMRKSAATPRSDLDRIANQRKFIGALAGEISSPGTFLNPFDVIPLLGEIPDALTIDEGDHLHHLLGLGLAMGGISDGSTVATTVPVTDGSATEWHPTKSEQLFEAMRTDTPIPPGATYN